MDSKLLSLVVVIFVLTVVTVTTASDAPQGDADTLSKDDEPVDRDQMKKFLSMMEKVDIDQILNNTRLMMNNIKCFLNEGPCSAQLKEMKNMLPMLIKDSCAPCTKEQKMMVKKAIDKVKALRPNEYKKLAKFFDPEGKYEKKFYDAINESQ